MDVRSAEEAKHVIEFALNNEPTHHLRVGSRTNVNNNLNNDNSVAFL